MTKDNAAATEFDQKEDTQPGRKLTVSFNGQTINLPNADGVGLPELYNRWDRGSGGSPFEVRDCLGRLVAVGMRVRRPSGASRSIYQFMDLTKDE